MTCPTRHNILWIVFDSLSETACAALPTLSAFRDSSLHFARAYAPSPEAGPARASLFTGLDMAAHGVWTEGVALPGRETTVAQRMADGGMRTWLVGRRQLAGASHWTTEHARPFEYAQFDWAHGPLHRSRQNAYLAWLEARAPEAYQEIFPAQPDPDATEISDRQRHALAALPDALGFNSWVGARVCAQLSQPAGGANFFGVAGLVVGETQGGAPNPHIPCETVDAGAMRQADAALAAMLERLDSTGLAERTAVVVTAARGALATSRGPMQDSALHVPLMIRMPGRAPRRTEAMVSTIDVAPTLYALADMPPPRRIQGRSLTGPKNPGKPADPIIVHPDVRRMLLTQKAYVEAARAFTYWAGLAIDLSHKHPDESVRKDNDDLVSLLTPVVKGFITDNGYESTTLAMQVLGGHGYITEWGLEQCVRDARINMIYEGTNTIQALDLLGRKVLGDMGAKLMKFGKVIQELIMRQSDYEGMKEFTDPLGKLAVQVQTLTAEIGQKAMKNPDEAGAAAVPYLRIIGHLVFSFSWCFSASVAMRKLDTANDADKAFYQSKLTTARFYFAKLYPETEMLINQVKAGAAPLMELDEANF